MEKKTQAKVVLSTTGYRRSEAVERNTEAITVPGPEENTVLEITPYHSLGLAQIATMTIEQSQRIVEYLRRQSKVLEELERTNLLLDVTYVPERSWNEHTLQKIPAGSAVFPVLELETVPILHVRQYLSSH